MSAAPTVTSAAITTVRITMSRVSGFHIERHVSSVKLVSIVPVKLSSE